MIIKLVRKAAEGNLPFAADFPPSVGTACLPAADFGICVEKTELAFTGDYFLRVVLPGPGV
jgi:hypothetical protein